ncbi:Methyltransf-33 domain-containing protein [Fusarium keratoplasticum]|uniref:Methyltransf-33 domain-containing protein n=1 Tax=Fusarium keratoplasticum TaxID=1328300 RepID=A0ACC0R5N5_9HYPO|nr:Methyltransf-33 domain-containing protein [Fusarium keratoplasticum]KAI8675621.1 Methyltransf-33 domain-containing protein [Fusarium keratoplasticum]KAI8682082.1 Methyltransf-33 domain-containing protein [Fusarium keratoplasticum]
MSSPLWNPADRQVLDIGGSNVDTAFASHLPAAIAGTEWFPKELAYIKGMEKWCAIANRSYQTSDELSIIQMTAKQVVDRLPSGTCIIDLGAADSFKFEPYVREFISQDKECTYVPLDLSEASLIRHIDNVKKVFPTIKCVGLWGSFQQGDRFFHQIPQGRLFLSLGSIFYNAPDEMCVDRCAEFRRHLAGSDRLIVGQDAPSATESHSSQSSYQTKEYDAFFVRYLEGIQDHAGIVADAKSSWTYESNMDKSMHFFKVTALKDMVCDKFGNYKISAGTSYKMFPSWKRGEAEIHEITKKEGLTVKTLGKAKNSGMCQYIIGPQ